MEKQIFLIYINLLLNIASDYSTVPACTGSSFNHNSLPQ